MSSRAPAKRPAQRCAPFAAIDQLCRDAHPMGSPAYAALQDVSHLEVVPDLLHVDRPTPGCAAPRLTLQLMTTLLTTSSDAAVLCRNQSRVPRTRTGAHHDSADSADSRRNRTCDASRSGDSANAHDATSTSGGRSVHRASPRQQRFARADRSAARLRPVSRNTAKPLIPQQCLRQRSCAWSFLLSCWFGDPVNLRTHNQWREPRSVPGQFDSVSHQARRRGAARSCQPLYIASSTGTVPDRKCT